MVKKVHYSQQDIKNYVHDIIRQLANDNWKPDYVVGLTRGGLQPALMISHYLNVKMETLKVSLRDGGECESNCWMSEEACGWQMDSPKNILIVDDINDTGATINWIKKDWASSVYFEDKNVWEKFWNHNIRVAVIVDNDASTVEVDYSAVSVNKAEEDVWIVFPWEEWWKI